MKDAWISWRRAFARGAIVALCALASAALPSPSLAAPPGCEDRLASCASSLAADLAAGDEYRAAPGERWIEVDLYTHEVRLRAGGDVLARLPAATGRNRTPGTTTYTGLFRVYSRERGMAYLPEPGVYVRDWVGFDPQWHNGFHSFPLDARGGVLDDRLRQSVTSGCIRTAASDVIYRFAQVGMTVLVRDGGEPASSPRPGPFSRLWRAA